MKPARIVLDHVDPPPPRSWCWRDDWDTGFDSAYGLLAKFARLNVLTARDLVRLFVSAHCGRKTALSINPDIDLRDAALFDVPAMASAMRLDTDAVRRAFLLELFPNGHRKSSPFFRWCARCAASGFHAPVFQLELVTDCPIHGGPLRTNCRRCKAQIPYRLRHDVLAIPFACPACGEDFAPALRDPDTHSLRLTRTGRSSLHNIIELLRFEDRILPLKMELNRERRRCGVGELVMAPADWRRRAAEYTGFVTQVLHMLQSAHDGRQQALPLVPVIETRCGTRAEPPVRRQRRKKKHQAAVTATDAVSGVKRSWDGRLHALYAVYAAIRRHLWRHVVVRHQACIASAGRHLWWHMEGERTVSFCPVAEAFLRWRMFWEGCGVPSFLFEPMNRQPYGLIGWQAEAAPVCPPGWSPAAERWVTGHLFAQACLSSFRDWSDNARRNSAAGRIAWSRHAMSGRFDCYWAVTGHDSWQHPVRLYTQLPAAAAPLAGCVASTDGRQHWRNHQAQLRLIRR